MLLSMCMVNITLLHCQKHDKDYWLLIAKGAISLPSSTSLNSTCQADFQILSRLSRLN